MKFRWNSVSSIFQTDLRKIKEYLQSKLEWSSCRVKLRQWIVYEYYDEHRSQWQYPSKEVEQLLEGKKTNGNKFLSINFWYRNKFQIIIMSILSRIWVDSGSIRSTYIRYPNWFTFCLRKVISRYNSDKPWRKSNMSYWKLKKKDNELTKICLWLIEYI